MLRLLQKKYHLFFTDIIESFLKRKGNISNISSCYLCENVSVFLMLPFYLHEFIKQIKRFTDFFIFGSSSRSLAPGNTHMNPSVASVLGGVMLEEPQFNSQR